MNIVDIANEIIDRLGHNQSGDKIGRVVKEVVEKHNLYDILTLHKKVNFQLVTREPCSEEMERLFAFYDANIELMEQYLPGDMTYYQEKYAEDAPAIFSMDINYFASCYITDAIRQELKRRRSVLVKLRPNSFKVNVVHRDK